MTSKRFLAIGLAFVAFLSVATARVQAQETKESLEAFRAELAVFWPQLLAVVSEVQNMGALFGVPQAQLNQLDALGTQDPLQVEQEIAALSDQELAYLKQQFDLLPNWQHIPQTVMSGMPPSLRSSLAQLATLSPADQPFPPVPDGTFADKVCGLVSYIGDLQAKQAFTDGVLISWNVAEGIYIVADTACMAYPCSVLGIFDIVPAIAGKLATCGVSAKLRIVAASFQAVYENGLVCEQWTVYDGASRRLDEKLSTAASDDSAGVRTTADAFANLNLHGKLEDRLDVVMTTRSTQDSVDGAREGRPPSAEKSVRTVVDHTDLVRLPQLERTIDETLELAQKQGELMRNFRDLLIRMQVESDLIDSGKSFREAMFQLPKNIPGRIRAFCDRDLSVSCVAAGPDLDLGTADDVADAALCPDDAKPAELCDSNYGVCSRTRATPCTMDTDCPGGETCQTTSHPCTVTRETECNFDEDCPQGRPKQGCSLADPQRGYIELVREIVAEAIQMTQAAGEQVYTANLELARADALIAAGDLKNGYTRFRKAYKQAVRIGRTGH